MSNVEYTGDIQIKGTRLVNMRMIPQIFLLKKRAQLRGERRLIALLVK